MCAIYQVGSAYLAFGGRTAIRTPGPIACVVEHGDVVAVLTEWLGGPQGSARRRVRANNLHGYDRHGQVLWRVHMPAPPGRELLLTGFLEDEAPFTLHEAHGWWVRVDPLTGRVVKAEFIA